MKTKLFVKPTDSPTYLNCRSYHNQHVFKSLPYSQFRRAVVVCSDPSDRVEAIDYMYGKFLKCGYRPEDLDEAKSVALGLNRSQILGLSTSSQQDRPPQQTTTLSVESFPVVSFPFWSLLERLLTGKLLTGKLSTGIFSTDKVVELWLWFI